MIVVERQQLPLGLESFSDLSTVKYLSPPKKTAYAEVQAHTKAVRWRDDGTAPTATIGHLIPAGKTFRYVGTGQFGIIEAEASATATVTYYYA